jgi:hypothetical protein
MSDPSDYLGYWSARAGNRTNQLLQEQNQLLRDLRRQQMTPEERQAEDDARARHEEQVALEEADRRKKQAGGLRMWGIRTAFVAFPLFVVVKLTAERQVGTADGIVILVVAGITSLLFAPLFLRLEKLFGNRKSRRE